MGLTNLWDHTCRIYYDFFKNSVKINIKNSKTALKTAQGGPATGFGSPRRLVGRFQSSGRKSGLDPKFRETKWIFSTSLRCGPSSFPLIWLRRHFHGSDVVAKASSWIFLLTGTEQLNISLSNNLQNSMEKFWASNGSSRLRWPAIWFWSSQHRACLSVACRRRFSTFIWEPTCEFGLDPDNRATLTWLHAIAVM